VIETEKYEEINLKYDEIRTHRGGGGVGPRRSPTPPDVRFRIRRLSDEMVFMLSSDDVG
jgi:hypothetical protein